MCRMLPSGLNSPSTAFTSKLSLCRDRLFGRREAPSPQAAIQEAGSPVLAERVTSSTLLPSARPGPSGSGLVSAFRLAIVAKRCWVVLDVAPVSSALSLLRGAHGWAWLGCALLGVLARAGRLLASVVFVQVFPWAVIAVAEFRHEARGEDTGGDSHHADGKEHGDPAH